MIGPATSFAAALRQYRLAACLTQEELAERAGLSVRGISDLERGVRMLPRRDTVALLARALGLPPSGHRRLSAAARELVAAPAPAPVRPGRPRRDARPAGLGAAPPAGATPPLIGRAPELAILDRCVAGEGPPILLLAGEPGIGKTRLLQAAATRAAVAGWSVLTGGCTRSGGQEPYDPLLPALQRAIDGRLLAHRHLDLQGCAWLVRLLPELAEQRIEPLPSWTLPADQERRLLFRAVGRFLANMAGPAGTLVILDDLQWACADALDLLVTLVRAHQGAPLRVVGAYRDTDLQPDSALSGVLADLAQAGLVAHRSLGPLADAEALNLLNTLAAQPVSGDVQRRLVQRAGGIPFFLVTFARGVGEESASGNAAGRVPWDVRHSIRRRAAALAAGARELLAVAAVAGRVLPRPLLLAVVALPEQEILEALEACCRARLLEETEGDAYRFAHDLIREV